VILNDAFEHIPDSEKLLSECVRVLVPGGRVYVDFPPYGHLFGAHLSDAIGIPWVHVFFSDKTLIKAYKKLVSDLPDGARRIDLRISTAENGKEYFSYINKMTLKRAKSIIKNFNVVHYAEYPLKFLKPLSRIFREHLVDTAVFVIEKEQAAG